MKPAVFGISGTSLTADETAFLRDARPMGVILFRRNIDTPEQVRRLNDSVRAALGRDGACLWVDQEGGRVQRLTEPHWEKLPAAARIGGCWRDDPEIAEYAAWLLGRIIADQVASAGFDIACAPVLDLTVPGTHEVIGDRAFGAGPAVVAALGRAVAEGLIAGGVLPVSKHWPGHGRALVDSHHDLPTVDTDRQGLLETDIEAFRLASDCAPIAMTGHLVFPAFDAAHPATLSAQVIAEVIRGHCGFEGFLISDDLDMKALTGAPGELAGAALAAGCDGVLQCSGDFATMCAVADALDDMTDSARFRWDAACGMQQAADEVDRSQLIEELRDVVE
ncbi:beta-N-acetylhexosaminidase [Minwuia sp.]|uniref:beta-N-acetylhexosaminidase n=1 Tax=Minwuia sp. TaxID=2493630 RepID=UPI003A8F77A6